MGSNSFRSLLMIHPFLVDCAWRNRNLSTPWPPILGERKGKLRDTLRLPAGSILHLFCHSRGGGNPGNKRVPFQGSPFNPPAPNLWGRTRMGPRDTFGLPAKGLRSSAHLCGDSPLLSHPEGGFVQARGALQRGSPHSSIALSTCTRAELLGKAPPGEYWSRVRTLALPARSLP